MKGWIRGRCLKQREKGRERELSEKGRKWSTFEEEHVYNTVH